MHVATHANIQLRWKSRDGTIIICKLLYRRTCKAVWINDSSSRNQLTIERYRWNNLSTSGKLVNHRSSTDEPFSLSREREKERLRESRIKVKSRSSVLLSSRISSSRMIVTRVDTFVRSMHWSTCSFCYKSRVIILMFDEEQLRVTFEPGEEEKEGTTRVS